MMNGKGKFRWTDNRVYDGEFLEGKRHGYGIYKFNDGRTYEGSWFRGKQHGKGKIILSEN